MITPSDIICIDLDSPRWGELKHAYGVASDIPDLLRQLQTNAEDDPWFELWSSLAHQGDVYSASFAAVPHIIKIMASSPSTIDANYFQFIATVEICRQEKQVTVPEDLQLAYAASIAAIPSLVAQTASRPWDSEFLSSALAAIAASKGFGSIADILFELTPEVADEFKEWYASH